MIAWQLDLQLPIQSLPIATKVVSLNPTHGEVFFPRTLVSSTNKTDRHDITKILLKVVCVCSYINMEFFTIFFPILSVFN
jgi:hypothetical protein